MKNKAEILKKHTTNINEVARKKLGITRDDYALCQYVQYRQADPRGKKSGWCSDPKAEMADFIGITRPGIYKMLERMERVSLLEIEATTGFCRVTGKWIDTEQNRKQSLQSGVNKVDTDRKQSLQSGVNKVTLNIEEKDIELEERDGERGNAPDPENSNNLEEEKGPLPPKVAPKGSAPTRPIPEASQDLLVKHYSPETPGIVEAELVTLAPLGVFPNAGSPKDLKAALLRYASEYPDNWRDNVLEVGRATDWTAERIGECLTDFCAYQFKLDNTRAKFSQYTASFSLWLKGQKRFDKPGASHPGPTSNKATLNRFGGDASKYEETPLF